MTDEAPMRAHSGGDWDFTVFGREIHKDTVE